jgi:hypothetical protein
VLQDLQVQLVLLVQVVLQVLMALLDRLDLQVQLDLLVQLDPWESLAQSVLLVRQEQQARQVPLAHLISQWFSWVLTNDKENGVVTNATNIKGTLSRSCNNNN